ncbi:MAG: PH domain-containing protein [Deltaproteobacteria bacterium]
MKNIEADFSSPRRQSPVALIFLAYKYFKIIVRTIWPIALALLVGKEDYKPFLLYGLILISIFLIIFTIIDYFRFQFFIGNNEIVIEKGVFKRSKTNIPFDRIQSINLEQGVLHQLLNVTKLEIDTAGSKEIEFSFSAFEISLAEKLRATILDKKVSAGNLIENIKDERIKSDTLFMSLSFSDLLKLGILQNHIKSFFIILAFLLSLYAYTDDFGFDAYEISKEIGVEMLEIWKIAIFTFAVFSIAISFLFSLIRTVIIHFDFRISRTLDGYKIISGLFNKKQLTVRDKKIQIIEWKDNPLKRLAGIYDVYLKQASSITVSNKDAVIIPACNKSMIERIKSDYFSDEEWEGLIQIPFSDKIIFYTTLLQGFFPAMISWVIILIYGTPSLLILPLLWIALIFFSARLRYSRWKCSCNEHILFLQKGMFSNNCVALKIYKIQTISMRQNWYQKSKNLSDVIIYTAAGKILLPFLDNNISGKMLNYFLHKVENDHRKWM